MSGPQDPVTWLLGNRELLVVLLIAAAWLVRKLGLTKEQDATARRAPDQDAEGDEARTRRVREEVRRRIAGRQAETVPEPPVAVPQQAGPVPGEEGGFLGEAPPEPDAWGQAPSGEREMEAVLARQRDLEKKMRELESAPALVAAVAEVAPATSQPPASPYAWLAQLREPQAARRAIILREVLGPPVGLRR